jgi:ribosomal protein S18 acetylase RimI-like enzyme
MTKTLETLSATLVASALEKNLIEHNKNYASSPKAEYRAEREAFWFASGLQMATMNAVVGAQIEDTRVESTITRITSFFSDRAVPYVWWVGPNSSPENLGDLLQQHGLQKYLDMPGMAVKIDKVNYQNLRPRGFNVKFVNNPTLLELWAKTQAKAFESSAANLEEYISFEQSVGIGEKKPWQRYIGFLDDTPVCVAALFLASGVAAIFNVATLPTHRRNGFATQITKNLLQRAKEKGYHIAVLKATPMGSKVYEKTRFKTYCNISMYIGHP